MNQQFTYLPFLKKFMKIILASGSPRRKELMEKTGLKFEIDPANIDERKFQDKSAKKSAEIIATEKAKEVVERHPNSIIIGSDLVVSYLDHQLGKPTDEKDAKKMLELLRGKTHQIFTGVAVINTQNSKITAEVDTVNIIMSQYSDELIDEYIKTGIPMDRGRAYGLQDLDGKLIKGFKGDKETILGLSTKIVLELIEKVK